jgi:hypothetical protein
LPRRGANNFWGAFSSFGTTKTFTVPVFADLNHLFLDFREIVIYVLLEALGYGCRVSFLIDRLAPGSLHILTEEVQGGGWLPKEDLDTTGGREFNTRYSARPTECFEVVLLAQILGLLDLHGANYWFLTTPGESPIQIFDFECPPMEDLLTLKSDYLRNAFHHPFGAPIPPRELGDPANALDALKAKLDSLPAPRFRGLLYPSMTGASFTDCLTGPGEILAPEGHADDRIDLNEFLIRLERKIRSFFFEVRFPVLSGTPDITPGCLIGFTEISEIWPICDLESAVSDFLDPARLAEKESALKDAEKRVTDLEEARALRNPISLSPEYPDVLMGAKTHLEYCHEEVSECRLEGFSKFWSRISGTEVNSKTRNMTANYALARLHYFRVWVKERRVLVEGKVLRGQLT